MESYGRGTRYSGVKGEAMMTEEEAKTKWCPEARVAMIQHRGRVSVSSNRDISLFVPTNSFDPNTDITKCIASACMCWRWDVRKRLTNVGMVDIPKDEWTGHCGLAGRT